MTKKIVIAALLLAASAAASAEGRNFDKTVAAEARGIVEISNVSGRLNIIGWERAEVSVHGTLDENVERVDVLTSKGRTTIKVVLPRMNWGGDGDADLEIRVPMQSEVQASAVSADLETSHLKGPQRLKTVSGDLRADVSGPDFEAGTVSGDMHLRGNGQAADMRLTTVSGEIVLERGAGEAEASSVSGEVRLDMDQARSVRMRSTSGDLEFRGSLQDSATLEAETVSGDVIVRSRGGLEYEASTFSGDIDNCWGKTAEATSQHGPGRRLMGTFGKGEARLRVKSMSGDVELCDH